MNVKYIMTEQMFFFETMLTLYGLVSYLVARTNREALPAIVILGVGTALMTLTRPQGAYVVPAIFGIVALLAWRRAWFALYCGRPGGRRGVVRSSGGSKGASGNSNLGR